MINRPFEVIVLHPHVSIFSVPFCHNSIPQFSGFLHVLTVESLKQRSTEYNTNVTQTTVNLFKSTVEHH